jgi:glycosyltransferase involved in cell wall biosynthesis
MKILFLTRRFYPFIGGVEKHVLEISKILIQSGHEVSVITELGDQRNIKNFEIKDGIKIYRINAGPINKNQKITIWQEMLSLKKIIQDADIVHCHDVFFWYLPFRFLFPNKPVYTTFHGYEGYPISKKAILIRKLSEKLSWGNICIGDFIKKWYGTHPTYVSYGAAAIKNNLPTGKAEKSDVKESAVFVGRLENTTGIIRYVEAFHLLKKTYPEFTLVVIGDGSLRSRLKQVTIIGFKKNPEQYFGLYRYAFVSGYLTILEAFAARKLVFAVYDNPLKYDYLMMTPFAQYIVVADTPEMLCKKIMYYMNHPHEERNLIEGAYKWVKKQSWENLAKTYLTLWKFK